MWATVIQTGVVIALVSLLTMDLYLPGGLIAGTCFTARSDTTSAFPFLNIAFGTAPLALDQWLVCAAMASAVLIYSDGQKLIRRHRRR